MRRSPSPLHGCSAELVSGFKTVLGQCSRGDPRADATSSLPQQREKSSEEEEMM